MVGREPLPEKCAGQRQTSLPQSQMASRWSKGFARLTFLVVLFLSTLINIVFHWGGFPETLVDDGPFQTTFNKYEKKEIILREWRKKRVEKEFYDTWFVNGSDTGALNPENADSTGPILDFLIAGFPKCGTTAMMRILSKVTTMPPEKDVCTPIDQVVHYSYNNWAEKYGNGAYNFTEKRPLKGSKCPSYIEKTSNLDEIGKKIPKTRLIIGMRHPVLWFQSFVNMQWCDEYLRNNYQFTKSKTVEKYVSKRLLEPLQYNHKCSNGKVCVARSRFQLSLAMLGKTPLDEKEKTLLLSEIYQSNRRFSDNSAGMEGYSIGGKNKIGIPNKVFIFESTQGKEEYFYQELADFVQIDRARLPPLDETTYRSGFGLNSKAKAQLCENKKDQIFDICLPKFDYVRKEILPISYTLGEWLEKYLIPASYHRDDLVIPNVTAFESIITDFGRDPCHDRLIRNDTDGEYYLAEKS